MPVVALRRMSAAPVPAAAGQCAGRIVPPRGNQNPLPLILECESPAGGNPPGNRTERAHTLVSSAKPPLCRTASAARQCLSRIPRPRPPHSASSISTICRELPSQNNCPSFFSCQAMPCRSTSRMKSAGRACNGPVRADLQKSGLLERNFSGVGWRFVKLQRPPPEMRIFLPGRSACSSTTTRRPRLPASMAHMSPAAPAPRTITSCFTKARRRG